MKRLFTALMLALMISCELVVDVDVPFESKQVTVNSFFNPDSLWSVELNLNRNILDEQPFQEIDDARIIVFEGGNAIDTLAKTAPGRFRSRSKSPQPGKTYTLTVSTARYSDVHATSSVPFPSPLTNIEVYESASNQNSMLKVKFSDDGSQTNYYELFVELEYEYYNYTSKQVEFQRSRLQLTSEDPALQNEDKFYSNSIVFKDLLFNGREADLTFKISGGGISHAGIVTVTLRTISEDGYNYLKTSLLQDMTSGDPFAQPVNVYNNIANGFGIFAGYSTSVYTKANQKPVITSIEPPTGKAGDHIIISGENFIPKDRVSVTFQSQQYSMTGQVVEVTPTRIEVIVPATAVTGRIVVWNGRMAVSDSDFVVIE